VLSHLLLFHTSLHQPVPHLTPWLLYFAQLFKENPKCPNDIPFETSEAVVEWDYGAYEGLVTKEIKQIKKDWWIWTDGCPPSEEHPGGESPEQMCSRVDGFIEEIRAKHREVSQVGLFRVPYRESVRS
jgi:broad specificity phosphatase PhoE